MEKKLVVELSGDDTCVASAHWSSEKWKTVGEEREERLGAEWALKARLQPFPQTTGDAAAALFMLGRLRRH